MSSPRAAVLRGKDSFSCLFGLPLLLIYAGFLSSKSYYQSISFISVCKTVSGPAPNKPCVFPFRFKGVTYKTCTFEQSSTPWCSTGVDKYGNHISNKGLYGNCDSRKCPMPEQGYKPRSGKSIHTRSKREDTNSEEDASLSEDSMNNSKTILS